MGYELQINHPFHLQHPLQLTLLNTRYRINNNIQTQSPFIFDKCCWCGVKREYQKEVYSCSLCSFCLCTYCCEKKPPLTIPNPKSHHHSLSFFPRPLLVPCDACGLVIASEASYACFQCNYVVHESCIELPRVIKLTRHPHRLYLTPYLPPAVLSCGVCYKAVDTRYGLYSCKHDDDCSYVIHSKCATDGNVWDGRELEGEPEYPINPEDFASFKNVGDGLIEYFCHKHHHLKLEKYDRARDAKKQCVACIFPIDVRCFYDCTQCDYSLHEVCAGLPRKLDHVLHKHPLLLHPPTISFDEAVCAACDQHSNGFWYKCGENSCKCFFEFRCILLPHFFTHKSHQHPIFTFLSHPYSDLRRHCKICDGKRLINLHCTKCEFAICYECASIPTEIRYKYDEHPLTLCYGEEEDVVGNNNWCEVCERKLDVKKWFYTCNERCITIHRECITGPLSYLLGGASFIMDRSTVVMIHNNSNTRLICAKCKQRCRYSLCFRIWRRKWDGKALCDFSCLNAGLDDLDYYISYDDYEY